MTFARTPIYVMRITLIERDIEHDDVADLTSKSKIGANRRIHKVPYIRQFSIGINHL